MEALNLFSLAKGFPRTVVWEINNTEGIQIMFIWTF